MRWQGVDFKNAFLTPLLLNHSHFIAHRLDSIFFFTNKIFFLFDAFKEKFKSHRRKFPSLSLECYVCALWILKHKYALYKRAFLIKCTRLSAFALDIILRKFHFYTFFALMYELGEIFIWLPQIAIFYVCAVYYMYGLCWCCWAS